MEHDSDRVVQVFGVLLVANWINTLLYTLEIVQTRRYFKNHSPRDPPFIRRMVLLSVLVDTVTLITEYVCVYQYAVTNWGDEGYVDYQHR
jgi:hypothetical protein